VERRETLASGSALTGAGKRAAFALFYGPLHFLLLDAIAHALQITSAGTGAVVDLGCGTGAAGAALALATSASRVIGIDRSQWALDEARLTYRQFGLTSMLRRGDLTMRRPPADRVTIVASYVLNELPARHRDDLLTQLVARAGRGDRVLIVEPIAVTAAPWWGHWQENIQAAGGRADVWRFRAELPPIVAKFDRAAGLDHRELTGRTFWLPGAR
jgi:SAM-dependent methyltransferase